MYPKVSTLLILLLSLGLSNCINRPQGWNYPEETRVLGYRIQGKDVIFEFNVKEYQKASREGYWRQMEFSELNIEKVAVSGEFNDWKKDGWFMDQINDTIYQLRKKLKDFDDRFQWQYKFIVNEKYWVEPPLEASNQVPIHQGYPHRSNLILNTLSDPLEGNTTFRLKGYPDAQEVIVSGSFNNWQSEDIPMFRIGDEWVRRINLKDGIHYYKYIVDGEWIVDPHNPRRSLNEFGTYNSILHKGARKNTEFKLPGHPEAQKVELWTNFLDLKAEKFDCKKEDNVWVYRAALDPGKYQYIFRVDGEWVTDPHNLLQQNDKEGNPYSIKYVGRQVLFRLAKFPKAKKVYLAGSFNDWHSELFRCKWIDGAWEFSMALSPGEHTYKYVVDGQWFTDPHNPQKVGDGAGNTNSLLRVE